MVFTTDSFRKTRNVGILNVSATQRDEHGGIILRRDAIFLRHILLIVDVDFHEGKLATTRVLVCELLHEGGDLLARTTPVGIKVGDDVVVGFENGVELALGVDADKLRHVDWYCDERKRKRRYPYKVPSSLDCMVCFTLIQLYL